MIVSRITGGLGNQLFQYAAGRSLAHRYSTALKLDTAEFDTWKLRPYDLDKFNITASTAVEADIRSFLGWKMHIPRRFERDFRGTFPFLYRDIAIENSFHFDTSIQSSGKDVYLIGFFQSEKYFSEIKGVISHEFTLKRPMTAKSRSILQMIRRLNSVSVNVRRGEYVSDPRVNARHGFINESYFMKAIDMVAKQVKTPHFFFFSDDIAWTKGHIRPEFPSTYVDINYPDKVYEDLILASQCKHNIITNSTFSWWVGWLNAYKSKIVVAPEKWFQDESLDTSDLFPADWILL